VGFLKKNKAVEAILYCLKTQTPQLLMFEINEKFLAAMKEVKNFALSGCELSHAELFILREVQKLGLLLLEMFVQESNAECVREGRPVDSGGALATSKGSSTVLYQSIFGLVQIRRQKFHSPADGTLHPLDARLNLPRGQMSFLLMKWLGSQACEADFRESTALLNDILGLGLDHMQSHRNIRGLGGQVGDYYAEKAAPAAETEGSYLCLEVDGKGVRLVETERATASETAKAEKVRPMKGEKRGHKRIATVAATFSFAPCARKKEELVNALHKKLTPGQRAEFTQLIDELGEKPRLARNTHKRAFMCDQAKAVAYAVRNLALRDPACGKPIIALVDGGKGLEQAIRDTLEAEGMGQRLEAVILDIIHVTEYLWLAANAILGERHPGRTQWVEKHLGMILDSEVDKVINALEDHILKKGTTKAAKTALEKVVKYYRNHAHKMDYKDYLEKGYPVSTGIVEGACGHLVKERMERSGMQWTIDGASATLDARAVKINGDWSDFIHHVELKNRERFIKIAA
jgi:hypothetical protein